MRELFKLSNLFASLYIFYAFFSILGVGWGLLRDIRLNIWLVEANRVSVFISYITLDV